MVTIEHTFPCKHIRSFAEMYTRLRWMNRPIKTALRRNKRSILKHRRQFYQGFSCIFRHRSHVPILLFFHKFPLNRGSLFVDSSTLQVEVDFSQLNLLKSI